MQRTMLFLVFLFCTMIFASAANAVSLFPHKNADPTGDQVLNELLEGNARFYNNKLTHPHQSIEQLTILSKSQHPHVVILTCSDSRVVPEVLFDVGLGDIFDIKVAGNVLDDAVIGSIEFGISELHVPLVIILGHESCGAVAAAVNHLDPHNHINNIIRAIAPAVMQAKHQAGDEYENSILNNVDNVAKALVEQSPTVKRALQKNETQIVKAYYSLETGRVRILGTIR